MFRFLTVVFCIMLLGATSGHADKASKLNKQGIEAYNKNDSEESVRHFTDALVERPDSPELRFNRGTALSASGKNDDAVSELDQAAAEFNTDSGSAAAYFNAGNTLFAAGNLEQAIEHYKKAVKLDQSAKDIRHNLELALRKKDEQDKQQQQDQKQDQQKQDDKKDQKDQKNDKNDEKQEQEKQDKEESNQDEQQNQGDQDQKQPENQYDQPMTQEEAKRILDAMDDEEKQALEKRKMMMQEAAKQGDDW